MSETFFNMAIPIFSVIAYLIGCWVGRHSAAHPKRDERGRFISTK